MPQNSGILAGVSYDDIAQVITISTAATGWATFFGLLPALTAANTEQYDAAFFMALESVAQGKDALINSPIGRGSVPTVQKSFVTRTEGSTTEVQTRLQLALCVYLKDAALSPVNAVNNDD